VSTGESGEYGLTDMNVTHAAQILAGFPKQTQVWMNHRDVVERLPNGFMTLATTEHAEHAAYASADGRICGVQYHPEVSHTKNGDEVLQNFIFEICGCGKEWSSGRCGEEHYRGSSCHNRQRAGYYWSLGWNRFFGCSSIGREGYRQAARGSVCRHRSDAPSRDGIHQRGVCKARPRLAPL
jgi:hypothetical protein